MNEMKATRTVPLFRCPDPCQYESACPHYEAGTFVSKLGDGTPHYVCRHVLSDGPSIKVCMSSPQYHAAFAKLVRDVILREQEAGRVPEGQASDPRLARIWDWTRRHGKALCPPGADTYGEGMRDAKQQVAALLLGAEEGFVYVPADGDGSGDEKLDKMMAEAPTFEFRDELWLDLKALIGEGELFENVKKVVQAKLDRDEAPIYESHGAVEKVRFDRCIREYGDPDSKCVASDNGPGMGDVTLYRVTFRCGCVGYTANVDSLPMKTYCRKHYASLVSTEGCSVGRLIETLLNKGVLQEADLFDHPVKAEEQPCDCGFCHGSEEG